MRGHDSEHTHSGRNQTSMKNWRSGYTSKAWDLLGKLDRLFFAYNPIWLIIEKLTLICYALKGKYIFFVLWRNLGELRYV